MRLDLHQSVRPPQVPPTKVLLVGERWDESRPTLRALASQEGMVFFGPSPQSLKEVTTETLPAVVMIGPGSDYSSVMVTLARHENGHHPLPVLVCVTRKSLESEDLYNDADDFLLVPCTPVEMGKRLKRLALKHVPKEPSSQLAVGRVALDLSTYQVTLDGGRVDLAWLEFQLLKFLMENPGRVFTREQLLAHVWGVENFGGTRTVDVHIRRLRHKLEANGERYFRTVKNVGYGMVFPQ